MQKQIKLLAGFFMMVVVLGAAAVTSTPVQAARLTQSQIDAVRAISAYFNSISTMKGKFTQIGPRGRVSNGDFYIVKPGKMRFEYAAPNPFLVVSDGSWVYVKNRNRRRVDHYPLTATPLRLILENRVNFFKEVKIQSVKRSNELTTIALRDTSSFASGSLVLVFDNATNSLQQWVVIDERGRRTTVTISDIKSGIKANPKLFVMKLPKSRLRDEQDRN